MLTSEQLSRGLSILAREGRLRWDLGDWAIDLVGPPTHHKHAKDGSYRLLREAVAELTAAVDDGEVSMVPSAASLRNYREAAAAIPIDYRSRVSSIDAARLLWQRVPDIEDRMAVLRDLTNDKGIVTVDAVRAWAGRAPTTNNPPETEKSKDAKKRAKADAAAGKTMRAHFWRTVAGITGWAHELNEIEFDDLGEFTGEEWNEVIAACEVLRGALDRWIEARLPRAPDLDVIDGYAVDDSQLALT